MPHIIRVLDICIAFLVAPLLLSMSARDFTTGEKILDLTRTAASERRSLGVPGSSMGGTTTAGGRRETYQLPLNVRIRGVELNKNEPNDVLVRIELTNTGKTTYTLPSCLDQPQGQHPGSSNRRTFEFGLEFPSSEKQQYIRELADVTYGSDSEPQCLITLNANESILVIFSFRIPRRVQEISLREARVFCDELRLADDRYYIKAWSAEIKSAPVRLDW